MSQCALWPSVNIKLVIWDPQILSLIEPAEILASTVYTKAANHGDLLYEGWGVIELLHWLDCSYLVVCKLQVAITENYVGQSKKRCEKL